MTERFDWIIIGAGIIGLTLARALRHAFPSDTILILEKENELACHASGRNSGVIHSGLYYKPETLKAQLCVEGARLMKEYCKEHKLAFVETGKVVVPTNEKNECNIDLLISYAKANGVEAEIIDNKILRELEPASSKDIKKAIYSPKTAIVEPSSILKSISTELKNAKIKIAMNNLVTSLDGKTKTVKTINNKYVYGHLINAAGAFADKIAHMLNAGLQFKLLPFKGYYYKLNPNSSIKINGNLYPVPDLNVPFLGVHFTKSIKGDVYIGPNAIPALGRENYKNLGGINSSDFLSIMKLIVTQYFSNKNAIRHHMHSELKKLFKPFLIKTAKELVPTLESRDLIACNKVGIRPQLVDILENKLVMDFHVEHNKNETHILNAISPAFTCSLSFSSFIIKTYFS